MQKAIAGVFTAILAVASAVSPGFRIAFTENAFDNSMWIAWSDLLSSVSDVHFGRKMQPRTLQKHSILSSCAGRNTDSGAATVISEHSGYFW